MDGASVHMFSRYDTCMKGGDVKAWAGAIG